MEENTKRHVLLATIIILFIIISTGTFAYFLFSDNTSVEEKIHITEMEGYEKAYLKGAKEAVHKYVSTNRWEDITSRKSTQMFAMVMQNVDDIASKLLIYRMESYPDTFYMFHVYRNGVRKGDEVFDGAYPITADEYVDAQSKIKEYENEYNEVTSTLYRNYTAKNGGFSSLHGYEKGNIRVEIFKDALLLPDVKYALVRHKGNDLGYLIEIKRKNSNGEQYECTFLSFVYTHYPDGFAKKLDLPN